MTKVSKQAILQSLVNTGILDKAVFQIACTVCSLLSDLNIEIHPMICFSHVSSYMNNDFFADCSVCTQYTKFSEYDDNAEDRKKCFDELKNRFINNKEPCKTCSVTYYGIKWWDDSNEEYIDYPY